MIEGGNGKTRCQVEHLVAHTQIGIDVAIVTQGLPIVPSLGILRL